MKRCDDDVDCYMVSFIRNVWVSSESFVYTIRQLFIASKASTDSWMTQATAISHTINYKLKSCSNLQLILVF